MLDKLFKNVSKKAQSAPKTKSFFIDIQNISMQYGKIVALSNINLQIKSAEFLSLVGPSGAGKSTLVRLLIREELPSAGHLYVAERDITTLSRRELPFYRRKVGVVFQDFKLLRHKTVQENISFALEVCDVPQSEIKIRLPKMLKLVSLDHRVDNYPDELSGGEKQRVSIARAMIHDPKILIADEPTGNLDPVNTGEIANLLLKINSRGTTVILATHNKTIVDQLKKRVVTIKNGEIIADQLTGKYQI